MMHCECLCNVSDMLIYAIGLLLCVKVCFQIKHLYELSLKVVVKSHNPITCADRQGGRERLLDDRGM